MKVELCKERCFVPQHNKSNRVISSLYCHAETRSISTSKQLLKINFILTLSFIFACNQPSSENKTAEADSATTKVDQAALTTIDSAINNNTETRIATEQEQLLENIKSQNVSVHIFSNDTTGDAGLKGYGYNILMNGKMYVHQPHIPAVPGNKGFASVADAKKAGAFIKYKVEHHIMPPSVTVEELDSLNINWK